MICKNCGEQTISKGKYCHSCGQKSDTHRLTLKHFIAHDVIHGVFHLDRGLLHTLKEIFTRPGGVALDYVQGKRKKYYNFFYLLLIIIGIYVFLRSSTALNPETDFVMEGASKKLGEFIKSNRKMMIFSLIPILGISSYIVFRRLQYTLLEFFIPAVIAVIGTNVFNIITYVITIIRSQFELEDRYDILYYIDTLLVTSILVFPLVTFAQFVKNHYSLSGKIFRLFIFYLLSVFIISVLLVLAAIIVTGSGSFRIGFE